MLKRTLAIVLTVGMILGACTACGAQQQPEAETTQPTEAITATEPAQEANVMKVLTLGSSSSVDSNHMINLVAHAEGFDKELIIGTLYYSGCTLKQHVQFLTANSNVYDLYISSTATPDTPPTIMKEVTMRDALRYDYWDVIVLQASGGESMTDDSFTNGNIQTIRKYVEEHKLNPLSIYGWHTIGVSSTDPDLIAMYPNTPNSYAATAEKYNYDRSLMLTERTSRVERYIMSDPSYVYVINTCTAVENAITSYLGQKGIKRDYTHLTDVGRLINSYVWYAKLAGIDQLEQIKLDAIPKAFLKSTVDKSQDLVLTEAEKAIILESVNNALKNPLQITPSQYTQAPAQ